MGQAPATSNWSVYSNQRIPRPFLAARLVALPLLILTNMVNTTFPNSRICLFIRGDGAYDFSYLFGTGHFPYGYDVLDND